jgi:hypothetical protein
LDEGFLAVVLVPFAFVPVDFAAVPFAAAFFEADAFVALAVEELDFAGADFVAVVLDEAALGALDFAVLDFAVAFVLEALVLDDCVERVLLFFLSPPGNALPTAFTASDAKSPTDPAILPAVLPTLLTTLPASGIGCSPFRRPSNGRSSTRCADVVPLGRARSVHEGGNAHLGHPDR